MMVGKLLSFWGGLVSGAILVLGRIIKKEIQLFCFAIPVWEDYILQFKSDD